MNILQAPPAQIGTAQSNNSSEETTEAQEV